MNDLQDVIVESTIRAFNAGYAAGLERAKEAARFVKFEHYDLEVIALSDFEEELKLGAKVYQSDSPLSQSAQGQEGNS